MNIYVSTDGENFEQVGEFTFELPWTAPDGTVVEGNSPLVPAEEVITLDAPVTARYVRLEITATNNDTGVSYRQTAAGLRVSGNSIIEAKKVGTFVKK